MTRRLVIILAVGVLIGLNLVTFLAAYPQVSHLDDGGQLVAKDFSAYYIGAWRLLHNPSQVYSRGYINDGEIHVYPVQEQYKYLPSFALVISPLLLLKYQEAIIAFDAIQFAMLPFVGLLVCLLLADRRAWIVLAVSAIALLAPSPAPGWGFSVAYFWLWKEGQAKVLETILLLLAFYAASKGKPVLSGILLGLSFFDPRFAVVSVPLFLAYNRRRLKASVISLLGTLAVSNVPLLYPGMAQGFIGMVLATGISTVFYPYSLIPLLTAVALSLANYREIVLAVRPSLNRPSD
jgi:hypothetical protein